MGSVVTSGGISGETAVNKELSARRRISKAVELPVEEPILEPVQPPFRAVAGAAVAQLGADQFQSPSIYINKNKIQPFTQIRQLRNPWHN